MSEYSKTFTIAKSGSDCGWKQDYSYQSSTTGNYVYSASATTGYNQTYSTSVDFSAIPAGVTITSVTIKWGTPSYGSRMYKVTTKSQSPTEASVLSSLNAGTRKITFKTNVNLFWHNFSETSATWVWMAWSVGAGSVTVKWTDEEPTPVVTDYTVKYFKKGVTGSDGWATCNVYYFTGNKWVQCEAYYYTGGKWHETNHSTSE